jgi:hypothetical protein
MSVSLVSVVEIKTFAIFRNQIAFLQPTAAVNEISRKIKKKQLH